MGKFWGGLLLGVCLSLGVWVVLSGLRPHPAGPLFAWHGLGQRPGFLPPPGRVGDRISPADYRAGFGHEEPTPAQWALWKKRRQKQGADFMRTGHDYNGARSCCSDAAIGGWPSRLKP